MKFSKINKKIRIDITDSQHKDLSFAERVFKVLIFYLGALPMRNGNFHMIIHRNRPIRNILDELHVHQK